MCVAVPGKVMEIFENGPLEMAKIDYGGVTKEACIAWVPQVKIGDYVIIHAGFALNIVDEEEALKTLELMQEVLENSESVLKWDTKNGA